MIRRLASLCILAAAPALAFIPSAGTLLKRAAARVSEGSRTRDVTISGTLELSGRSEPRTLVLRFPLACRFEGGASVKGSVAQPISADPAGDPERELLDLACPFIAYRGLRHSDAELALRATAAAAGVDLGIPAALSRLGDRVVVVLGAPARQLDRPQLWLYKDGHAPARLIARRDGRLNDLRLLEYGNPASAEWFPRILELYQDGKLAVRFEALETKGFRETSEEEEDDSRE